MLSVAADMGAQVEAVEARSRSPPSELSAAACDLELGQRPEWRQLAPAAPAGLARGPQRPVGQGVLVAFLLRSVMRRGAA